jgi:RND family efflux transporter MFP subunit
VNRVLILAFALTASACGGKGGDEDERSVPAPQRAQADGVIKLSPADRSALGLTVATVAEEDFPNSVVRFGVVVVPPSDDAPIIAPVTGRVAQPPRVMLGAAVRSGAVIADVVPVFDAPDQRSVGTQAAEREGQIAAGQREVAKADADAARARALSPQVVSAAKLQDAETAAAQARARLSGLQTAHSVSSGAQTTRVPVVAPIDGTIAALPISGGTPVRAGDVLGRIVKSGPVWIDVAVPPDEAPGDAYEVLVGQARASARLFTRGMITEADGMRHDRVIENSPHLASLTAGASVVVRIAHGQSRGIVVPEGALIPGIEHDTVFIETAPSVFVQRDVRVEVRYGGRVRVTGNLKPGDQIVVQGAMALYGERVRALLQPS